jgi:endonuclease/exonuclease/phosphatase family metal-dependent hydrolase
MPEYSVNNGVNSVTERTPPFSGGRLDPSESGLRLRLLNFNMQVGLHTRYYGDYLMGAWRHVLPSPGMRANLDRIAELTKPYDIVALQEGDAGSLRTLGRNQIEYLAHRADFPSFGFTVTRDLSPITQHCLGYLSRFPPRQVTELRLPSLVPGRRALRIAFGPEAGGLEIMIAHLSLTARARHRQLDFICEHLPSNRPTVLLGDLNCEPDELLRHSGLRDIGLSGYQNSLPTYPSWRPHRRIDHVLVSPQVRVFRTEILPRTTSDHLPLAVEIGIPTPV